MIPMIELRAQTATSDKLRTKFQSINENPSPIHCFEITKQELQAFLNKDGQISNVRFVICGADSTFPATSASLIIHECKLTGQDNSSLPVGVYPASYILLDHQEALSLNPHLPGYDPICPPICDTL